MADEAVIIELNKNANSIRMTVADGTGIEKGTLCKLSDPRTAVASDGANVLAGIAATEKVASDGQTSLGFWVPGQNNIFDLKTAAGAGITAGEMVKLSGANLVTKAADADFEAGKVIGKALEDSSDNEVIAVVV